MIAYMKKITPFLWFDDNLEEALNFYTSVFENAKIIDVQRMGGPEAPVITATFELEGQTFHALQGGPQFKFTEAISFFVACDTQAEIDDKWAKLSAGGQEQMCGWLKDKFGLSWQIVPSNLQSMLNHPDPAKAQRAMQAMLKMVKLEIPTLERALEGN